MYIYIYDECGEPYDRKIQWRKTAERMVCNYMCRRMYIEECICVEI